MALEHVQIAPRPGYASIVDDALKERGLSRRVVRAVPYFLAGLLLVSQTDYILTLSERVARLLALHLQVRLLEPPLGLPAYALSQIWHPRFDGDPAHRWLSERFVLAAHEVALDWPGGKRRR